MTTDTEKLQKVMARCGLGSRRAMELWIEDGRARINGRIAKLGDRVGARDSVLVDGEHLPTAHHQQNIQCLIYHKPEGEVCTRADTQDRPTVFDNLPELPVGRWVSVGRLDINTSGLLLFTNNGDLANRLMHPSTGIVRRYLVRIRGQLSEKTINLITGKGVMLDGQLASFDALRLPEIPAEKSANNWVEVSIKEGRYREVRRIFEQVGHLVSRLKRISYGTVKLSRQLRLGHSEKMAPMQLERLLSSSGLDAFLSDIRGNDADDAESNANNLYGSKKRQTTRAITRPRSGATARPSAEGGKAKQARNVKHVRNSTQARRNDDKPEHGRSATTTTTRNKRASGSRRKKTSTRRSPR